jgi:predicted kinase
MPPPTLVILGGLPAVGKSTVASALNEAGRFAYVRIDSIEQALRFSGEMGPHGVLTAGYVVAYAVSGDLLDGGNDVLVECVNPIEITRTAWREVASTHGAALVQVELYCSDPDAHRERAESRVVNVPGLELPDWRAIQTREYEAWDSADLHIDTSTASPLEAASLIRAAVSLA